MRQRMCGSVAALTRLGLEPAAEDLVQRDLDRGVDHERAPLHHGSPVPRVCWGSGRAAANAKLATGGSSGQFESKVRNNGHGPSPSVTRSGAGPRVWGRRAARCRRWRCPADGSK